MSVGFYLFSYEINLYRISDRFFIYFFIKGDINFSFMVLSRIFINLQQIYCFIKALSLIRNLQMKLVTILKNCNSYFVFMVFIKVLLFLEIFV